jgi:hypothetical protein
MKLFPLFLLLLFPISIAFAASDSVFVTFSGDTVNVWNTQVHENCAARFAFSTVFLDSNGIVITECDTVKAKANCTCTYDLCVSLVSFVPGNYTVMVYRQYLRQYMYPADTVVFIGSATFQRGGLASSSLMSKFYQSPCNARLSVQREETTNEQFYFSIAYPNPTNPSFVIRFQIPAEEHVTIEIFDLLGRKLTTPLDERRPKGAYEVRTDPGVFQSSGSYFCRLTAGGSVETRKILVVK